MFSGGDGGAVTLDDRVVDKVEALKLGGQAVEAVGGDDVCEILSPRVLQLLLVLAAVVAVVSRRLAQEHVGDLEAGGFPLLGHLLAL